MPSYTLAEERCSLSEGEPGLWTWDGSPRESGSATLKRSNAITPQYQTLQPPAPLTVGSENARFADLGETLEDNSQQKWKSIKTKGPIDTNI